MVEEVVGNVTSFLRRWVMGALEHQHTPLPQDEGSGPYRFSGGTAPQSSWGGWFSSAPPGYSNYAPTLQDDDDLGPRRDEDLSPREWRRRDDRDGGRDRDRDLEEAEEERERKDLERALELSRKEAEELQRTRKAEEEAAAAAAAAAAPPLPDLMNMEADLLGLGGSVPVGLASSAGSAGAGAGDGALIPYDPTASDEAIARALHLLDADFGPTDSELMSKIQSNKPQSKAAAEADLLALVDSPAGAPGLDSQSGALVAINPNKMPFRPTAAQQNTCAGCGRKIDAGRFLSSLGKNYHPQCFKCKGCSLPISDREFKNHEGAAYHDGCYKERFHPKCTVCSDYIAPDASGMIRYHTVPFWDSKTCIAHSSDGTPTCASCNRLEPRASPYAELKDGRKVCLECVDTVVVDREDCMPLFVAVQEFFAGLGMPVRQEIPLYCVELQALNEAAAGEKGHRGHSVTRGLCLSEVHTIRTVVRLPGASQGLPFGGIGEKVETLSRHCEVTAILVLFGLPRLLTGEILAHELMHAWLRLDGGFQSLDPQLEEGLCQVLAHLWLQAQAGSLVSSQAALGANHTFQTKFAEFCMHQIAMDSSPVYGEGFRKAYTATVQHGLLHTLDAIRKTGKLPQ